MCAERSASGGASSSSLSRKNSKKLQARVFLLDDSVHTFSINSCASGSELFSAIVEKQSIVESDYFDLEFVNSEGVRCWIDHTKSIVNQVGSGKDLVFIFAVKFYTPHPNLLEEEYTRYLFALQIKRDIVSGQLICSTNTAALLASYIAQAEIGDFIDEEYFDNNYLRQLKLVNQPNDEILNKIMEFHKTHIDMSPSEADFYLLDTARKIEYYGVKMHLAKDHENLPLNLSVTHMGVVVFQNLTKINTFSWAKIRKLSFKRKKFLIKLHPEGYGYYKGMVEFYFETRDDCKRFWKKCIEHHSFFRCPASDKSQRKKPRVVTKGSSFRYSGRTQKELIEYVRENYSSKRDNFERPTRSKAVKPATNARQTRLVKSYHPFAIKSSHSAPSRAMSDSSELNRAGTGGSTHTPRQQRSVSGVTRPRWSHSAGPSPHENREAKVPVAVAANCVKIPAQPPQAQVQPQPQPQKRSRKGRKFIQVSRTGSSADDDDDKRVTASEMSLSSSGRWEAKAELEEPEEEPMPAREAFRGSERLCRQRASIGGLGDVSDGEQPNRRPVRPVRQASEPGAAPNGHADPAEHQEQPKAQQRIVCIDQYRSARRPRPSDQAQGLPLVTGAKRYKSTPSDVAGDSRVRAVDRLDGKELLADIPYVLLRRHKSPDQQQRQRGHSRPCLSSKSLKSVHEPIAGDNDSGVAPPSLRHSKSLDRKLAAPLASKSPRLLREEYLNQSAGKEASSAGRAAIEALKSQLRASTSVRSVVDGSLGRSQLQPQAGPMFVSAYRLPPVNNFSAKDDTVSPRARGPDSRIYGGLARGAGNTRAHHDGIDDDDDEVDSVRAQGKGHSRGPGAGAAPTVVKDSTTFSDSDDSQLRETTDLESLLGMLPGNQVYLDSSSSSDDGEFDISPDRCSRPRSVSENEFKLRTPRSSRRSSLCRGHNSSLSLTDSSFNSGASFQSEDDDDRDEDDLSGSPYSFLADCAQHPQHPQQHQRHSQPSKNGQGSSGDPAQLPDDGVPHSKAVTRTVDLQVLAVPLLPDDSPDEDREEHRPVATSRTGISKQGRLAASGTVSATRALSAGSTSSGTGEDAPAPHAPAAPSTTGAPAPSDHLYESIFEQALVPTAPAPAPGHPPPHTDDLDMALVFLNKAALSSISIAKLSPTDSANAYKFQETVEGNLMSYESSEYASRAHSTREDGDEDEEPDEYVLPDDHRGFSPTSTSTSSSPSPSPSRQSSDSGEYPAARDGAVAARPIPEQSDTSSSASEGSEEIEPFPPPPPPADLLIFDERDEDIFQQMQQQQQQRGTKPPSQSGGHPGKARKASSEFPRPPPPLPPAGPPTSAAIPVPPPGVEEAIVPRFSRLLYGEGSAEADERCSLVYDDDHECEIIDIRGDQGRDRGDNCGFESMTDEGEEEEEEGDGGTMSIPRFYSFPCDYEAPSPCSPGLRQLNCQSPAEVD